jgi:hypothetical protein
MDDIDISYYDRLADEASDTIMKFAKDEREWEAFFA